MTTKSLDEILRSHPIVSAVLEWERAGAAYARSLGAEQQYRRAQAALRVALEADQERICGMLTSAAAEGIRVGKAGTDGDHTASGIAGKILASRLDLATQEG